MRRHIFPGTGQAPVLSITLSLAGSGNRRNDAAGVDQSDLGIVAFIGHQQHFTAITAQQSPAKGIDFLSHHPTLPKL